MKDRLDKIKKKFEDVMAGEDLAKNQDSIHKYDEQISKPDFWNDREKAQEIVKKRSVLKNKFDELTSIKKDIEDSYEFLDIASESGDEELKKELEEKTALLEKRVDALAFRKMLDGPHDINNAIVSINSGAGGTESQDWVTMLLRMYLRWAERKGYKTEVTDDLPGEEAGLKNVTFTVTGNYAYGYLRAEIGVHRLVRISPFDANQRRHTSFASVLVTPEIEDDIEVEVRDEDLRIDTYRASGAGGQHVNKTDSAVRITHLPTGIVVACQNERSQHKNKSTAMRILRSKLYEKKQREQEEKMAKLQGEKRDVAFGNQIRSYVLHPYRLVKDHRTDFESGNADAVLDGALDGFIEAYLMKK